MGKVKNINKNNIPIGQLRLQRFPNTRLVVFLSVYPRQNFYFLNIEQS